MRPIPWPDPPLAAGEIVLRRWHEADLPAIAAACGDPLIARFLPSIPQPYRAEHAQWWFERQEPARLAGDGIELAIARAGASTDREGRADRFRVARDDPEAVSSIDEVLGAIALQQLDWEGGVGVVGYWLAPAARGRGAATTAVRLLSDWALEALALDRVELTADVANAASQRVATRCGFVREALLRNHLVAPGVRRDTALYARSAPR